MSARFSFTAKSVSRLRLLLVLCWLNYGMVVQTAYAMQLQVWRGLLCSAGSESTTPEQASFQQHSHCAWCVHVANYDALPATMGVCLAQRALQQRLNVTGQVCLGQLDVAAYRARAPPSIAGLNQKP